MIFYKENVCVILLEMVKAESKKMDEWRQEY